MYNSVLTWSAPGTPDTKDEDGNIIPGTPGEEISAVCRYENFRLGNRLEFIGRNGKTVLAVGRVYVKFGQPVPPRFFVGTIRTGETEIYKGEFMNVFDGQMNSTIYTVEDVRT